MARVLVTRAEPGAAATARRLEALGHTALRAPMLLIQPAPAQVDDISQFQGLAFTSSNGVHAFAAQSPLRTPRAWCVGEATADAALQAGFLDVHIAGGDVHKLAQLIAASASPEAGPLLHVAGADLAGDLAALLRPHGFETTVRTFYRAVAAQEFSAEADAALVAPPQIDAVLFHSARGARTFATLARGKDGLPRIDALCLSEAVAAAVRPLTWRRVAIAGEPLDSALLALLPD
jgi:uroporphyrinogen-III synthase